jgi:YD repeat-containing protein
MRKEFGFLLLAVGCASSPSDHKLPSATFTPHLDSTPAANPCGDDIAFYGDPSPDLRYAFTYDGNGLVTHAEGVFTAGGPDDAIDYTWDASDNLTHMLEANGSNGSTEITAAYDATNGLTSYTWGATWGGQTDNWTYAMSGFVAPWQPTTELISEQGGGSYNYTLAWDADGRLVTATPDQGPATTYTYDDTALTITIDTGSGAFHGVISYDAQDRELSENWGGTDPQAIASAVVYNWNGDQFAGDTYSSGSPQAPQTLQLVETDTMRYDCSMSRQSSHAVRLPRPTRARR